MMYCSRDIFFKEPFGAVAAGTPVSLRLLLPHSLRGPLLEVYLGDTQADPVFYQPMAFQGQRDDQDVYMVTYTPPSPGVYFYRFALAGGRLLGMDPGGLGQLDDPDCWQLTVYAPDFETPATLHGCVFYQIFPDRFCNSGTPKDGVPSDRKLHKAWEETPKDRPDPDGIFRCDDYFGGDLRGITQQLPYIESLGVEAIYLNPIFEAHANHRYNTADFMRIDPLLGTNDDFAALCAAAHARGIKIILDGVFNHTGSDSVYFNKEGRYGPNTGATRDPESPYRAWFSWIDYPKRYNSWWGFETLPDLNEDCQSYRDFICGPEGVLAHWLQAGADGFRLDVADELPDRFIQEIRATVKGCKPDALLLGEVWEDASNKHAYGRLRQYFQGRELDSVMNYPWRLAILSFVRYGGGQALLEALCIILENYPPQVLAVALNSLSTHDVPRAITFVAAEHAEGHDRDWQRAHNILTPSIFYTGRQLFLLASLLQYTLPGCPCLYYGDEAGLVGYADPFNRGTYPWGREDVGLVDFFRLLGQLRKSSDILRRGSFEPVQFDDSTAAYLRCLEGKRILVCVNRSTDGKIIPWDSNELEDATLLLKVGGMFGCDLLEGHSGAVFLLD